MSAGFTPGPWEWEEHELSEGYSCIVYAANGMKVGTDHLSRADAALIAAAPDLYTALLDAHHAIVSLDQEVFGPVLDGHGELRGYVRDELLEKLRAALAKAVPMHSPQEPR